MKPLWPGCPRRKEPGDHRITVTYRKGSRGREYRCTCGHVGWSKHPDLAFLAGPFLG